jgi:hypothetical protein
MNNRIQFLLQQEDMHLPKDLQKTHSLLFGQSFPLTLKERLAHCWRLLADPKDKTAPESLELRIKLSDPKQFAPEKLDTARFQLIQKLVLWVYQNHIVASLKVEEQVPLFQD